MASRPETSDMDEADFEGFQWIDLPDHVLVNVFSFLELKNRLQAALTCKTWYECFLTPILWRNFKFRFFSGEDSGQLRCIELYGSQLRNASIVLNQTLEENRNNACEVIKQLAEVKERRLQEISIRFVTDNPLFFQGGNFLSSLALLFGPPAPSITMHSQLRKVDLSNMAVSITDLLLLLLANNHPTLEVLNIQNDSLTCHVSTHGMVEFVQKCRKLRSLSTFYKSVSEDVFKAFAEPTHVPLEYLSLACRREEKYHNLLSFDSWDILVNSSPKLRVSISFDHTIERHQIEHILQPQIPITDLSMRTMSELHHEVGLVASFYQQTLEVFVIITKATDALKKELISLVSSAPKLRVLHCLCGLDEETIETIKSVCPTLEEYTLRSEDDFREMQRVFIERPDRYHNNRY